MAAVILVLAEDIGDEARGPFVGAVVRAVAALTQEQTEQRSAHDASSPEKAAAAASASAAAGRSMMDSDIAADISRDEGDVPAPPMGCGASPTKTASGGAASWLTRLSF